MYIDILEIGRWIDHDLSMLVKCDQAYYNGVGYGYINKSSLIKVKVASSKLKLIPKTQGEHRCLRFSVVTVTVPFLLHKFAATQKIQTSICLFR
jgi:hypothetical protein